MNNDQHIVCEYFVFHLSFYSTHKNDMKSNIKYILFDIYYILYGIIFKKMIFSFK